MEEEKKRIWKISKNFLGLFGTLLIMFLICKLAVYFLPFFIALILAIITEPIIKFNMNKLKMSRRMSSIIVVIVTILLIIALTTWAGIASVSKLTSLSKNIPSIVRDVSTTIENSANGISDELTDYVSDEVIDSILNSLNDIISSFGTYAKNLITSLLNLVLSVPKMIVNIIITILAFVLFTKDRLNIINMVDFHFPENWIRKGSMIKKEIFDTLGSYLKVYSKILLLTAIELMICFWFLNAIGFKIEHVVRLSIVIALVDILPILGIGTVLIPWGIWSLLIGETGLGIALLLMYIILTVIRQTVEPKLVSKQLEIHPIITLIAMYAGFKLIGFSGLLLGPFVLVVLRCIYAEQIKEGFFKSLVKVD